MSEIEKILDMDEFPIDPEMDGVTALASPRRHKAVRQTGRLWAGTEGIGPITERTALILFKPLPDGSLPLASDPEVVQSIYPEQIESARAKGEEELRKKIHGSSSIIRTCMNRLVGRFTRAEKFPETVQESEQELLAKLRILTNIPDLTFGQAASLYKGETTTEDLLLGRYEKKPGEVIFRSGPKPKTPQKSHLPHLETVEEIRRVRPQSTAPFELKIVRQNR